MIRRLRHAPALALIVLAACGGGRRGPSDRAPEPRAPVAEVRPHEVVSPHGTRVDPYYWLRDDRRQDPDVLAYLDAENAYSQAMLAPTAALQQDLFDELVGRIQEDDATVPVLDDGYWYYVRYQAKQQYPIHARREGTMDAPEEVMLDGNQLAGDHPFYKLAGVAVSPGGGLVAYAEDTVGRNQFTLRIKDLATGEVLPDRVDNIAPGFAWGNDDKTLFYVAKDATTLRSRYVYRHVVGERGGDTLVHDEADGAFDTSVAGTKSEAYVQIVLSSTVSTEVRLIDANAPASAPVVFLPRERDHEYEVDHLGDRFWVRSNWQAENFRLMEVGQADHADRAAWREVVPHRDDVFLAAVAVYDDFLVLSERAGGLRKARVVPEVGAPFFIDADDAAYTMYAIDTPDPASRVVRYAYSSLTTPTSTYELDVATGARTLLKQEPVLGGFDAGRYASEYLRATAADGTAIPISVVYRKDTPRDGTAPLLVYGYGSYGASMDPRFSSSTLSLLDRGWVYAIAHVRGGQELGRRWYDDGKLMKKANTFTDFIACTEHLVAGKYGAADQVFASGRSAGGLLMGAIVNLRPDLYRGVIAGVPFVDVVTTMMDETIPLTTNEFDEWGNPVDRAAYEYMLSYSPYDNVAAKAYPSLLVTTGLWDSQVQYFEPAKWVAKLRAHRTDDNLLLLTTDMEAGHGGKSGRYDHLREVARDFAFLLHVRARPDRR